jgi:hypothetical protein
VLYATGRGQVVEYNPSEHGIWEIYQTEMGGFGVRQVLDPPDEGDETADGETNSLLFPIEAHLRDFLIANLTTVRDFRLSLFTDDENRIGKEYPTDVGPIDILAVDEAGDFYVFELKLSRGPDRALGQLLRYMGWVQKHLAGNKEVRGIIVASKMDTKLRYAVTKTPDVSLYEYQLRFDLTKPPRP